MSIPTRAVREFGGLFRALILFGCALSMTGCATGPYGFGRAQFYQTSSELAAITSPQIERGKNHALIDGFGWVWGIPNKIILFDRRVDNHRIDHQTEAEIAEYLRDNELSTVKVRLNQYHPGDDWKRLAANKSVGAGWRYTFGAISVLGETVIPGRLFGGDHYNPYTNTVHLYSNVPAIAFHEGGHAKDWAGRTWKGTYAAAYLIPGVNLYHEGVATGDALRYVESNRDLAMRQEAYNILYPAYGTYLGSAIGGSGVGYFAGAIGGHIAGRWRSSQLEDKPENIAHREARNREYLANQSAPNNSTAGHGFARSLAEPKSQAASPGDRAIQLTSGTDEPVDPR